MLLLIVSHKYTFNLEDSFCLKIVQFGEISVLIHSVFVIAATGTGKTHIIESFDKTYQIMRLKPYNSYIDPKAVTTDESYKVINPSTR